MSRVHSGGLDDDMTILDEFLDMSMRVGVANFSLFGGVEPDFAFANANSEAPTSVCRSAQWWA